MHKLLLLSLYLILHSALAQSLYPYKDQNLYGYINKNGQIIIPAKFILAKEFSKCGLAKVIEPNEKFGFINKLGEYILPPKYILATSFQRNKAFIFENNTYKTIDTKGKIITTIDENIREITFNKKHNYDGYIVKTKSGKSGVINTNGDLVIDTIYTHLESVYPNIFINTEPINMDSNSYTLIDYKNIYPKYKIIDCCKENWLTGLSPTIIKNIETNTIDTLIPTPIKKHEVPFYVKREGSIIQYRNHSDEQVILETKYSYNNNISWSNYKRNLSFRETKNISMKTSIERTGDSFTYYPDKNAAQIKQYNQTLFPIQEFKNENGNWSDPRGQFILTCRDCYEELMFKTVNQNQAYKFVYPELYGDIKVSARIKLEVIEHTSDTNFVYSKPYQTKVPSYLLVNLSPYIIKDIIDY